MSHRRLLLSAMLIMTVISPASPTDNVTIVAQTNVTIGAGFGELTPGPHDLSVTIQINGVTGQGSGYAVDYSGQTIWSYDNSSAPTSPKFICHGVTEDLLGCISVGASVYDINHPEYNYVSYSASMANITLPCYPSCMGCYTCDTTREGEIKVTPGGTAALSVTIQHTASGTLTVAGTTGDLQLLDQYGSPFTSVHIGNSGPTNGVMLTLSPSVQFNGPAQLRAIFTSDNGPLDAQDIVIVKKLIKLDKIIVDGSDPEDEGPTGVEIGNSITLRALANPAAQDFDDGEPIWTLVSQPYGSQTSISSGSATVSIMPDVPGAYTVRATAGGVSDDFVVWAVKFIKQNLGPMEPISADF